MESLNESDRQKIAILQRFGNSKMTGYVGDITSFTTGTDGVPEYRTVHEEDGITITSTGCILSDSILIKQIDSNNFYQLYSWDLKDSNYTHIVFDSENTLDNCYYKVRAYNVDLSKGDIVDKLKSIDVDMEHVTNILTDQEKDTLKDMFTLEDGTPKSSFKR